MKKVFTFLLTVSVFGCSSDNRNLYSSINFDPEACGEVIVLFDEPDRSSFFNEVNESVVLTKKDKILISEEFKSTDYTHLKVRVFAYDGRRFLFVYGDSFANPNQGCGYSTLYEFINGKWESVQYALYD